MNVKFVKIEWKYKGRKDLLSLSEKYLQLNLASARSLCSMESFSEYCHDLHKLIHQIKVNDMKSIHSEYTIFDIDLQKDTKLEC